MFVKNICQCDTHLFTYVYFCVYLRSACVCVCLSVCLFAVWAAAIESRTSSWVSRYICICIKFEKKVIESRLKSIFFNRTFAYECFCSTKACPKHQGTSDTKFKVTQSQNHICVAVLTRNDEPPLLLLGILAACFLQSAIILCDKVSGFRRLFLLKSNNFVSAKSVKQKCTTKSVE